MRYLSILFVTFLIAAISTGIIWRYAVRKNVLDVPNERSSHKIPVPRGGGLSIVVAASAAFAAMTLIGIVHSDLFVALFGGGLAVAAVGFLDDRYSLAASVRLLVHFAAALWALIWLDGLPALQIGKHVVALGWVGYLMGTIGVVWILNLFNFMDGIDGIAASEAIFIACGGALLAMVMGAPWDISAAAFMLGAACAGFLLWNWPPARIFMGDIGSGYLGYVLAVLALVAIRENPNALFIWLTLGGFFFVDATVTLIRRFANGERIYHAHRTHAYQQLAQRWGSHRKVTVMVLLVNVIWLLPCASLAASYPKHAAWIAVVALAPIAVFVVMTGAGRSNRSERS